jgi:hypothetical protein
MSTYVDIRAFHRQIDEELRGEPGHSALVMRRISREIGLTARLQDELREADDRRVQAAAARTLMRLREDVPPDTVLDLLDSDDPIVVMDAAEAAALFRDPGLFLPVLRALCDRTPAAPEEGAVVLHFFGEDVCPTAHGLLKNVLRQHLDAEQPEFAPPVDLTTQIDRDDVAAQAMLVGLLVSYQYGPAFPTFSRLLRQRVDEGLRTRLAQAVAVAEHVPAEPGGACRLAA